MPAKLMKSVRSARQARRVCRLSIPANHSCSGGRSASPKNSERVRSRSFFSPTICGAANVFADDADGIASTFMVGRALEIATFLGTLSACSELLSLWNQQSPQATE